MGDREVIEAQLGRPPRGDVTVEVRCSYGLPFVVRTSPTLEDGSPFPTRWWLSCPLAVKAVSTLEHGGTMRQLNDRLESEPDLAASYATAHERYIESRGDGWNESAGGMPTRVKCLHALYAHEVADANPIGAIVRSTIEPLGCPGPCVTERDGVVARVKDHPAPPKRAR
jgi:uncharacterized protein